MVSDVRFVGKKYISGGVYGSWGFKCVIEGENTIAVSWWYEDIPTRVVLELFFSLVMPNRLMLC